LRRDASCAGALLPWWKATVPLFGAFALHLVVRCRSQCRRRWLV